MKQFFLARQYPRDESSFVCANLFFQVLTTPRAIPCTVDSNARAPFDSTTCLRLQPPAREQRRRHAAPQRLLFDVHCPSGPASSTCRAGIINLRRELSCLGTSPSGSDALKGTATPGSPFRIARNPSNRSSSRLGNSSAASMALSKAFHRRQWKWPPSTILNPRQRPYRLQSPSLLQRPGKLPAPASASPCA